MPTLRPLLAALLGALLAAGCAESSARDRSEVAEGELGEDEDDAIRPLDAEGVLLSVNDPLVNGPSFAQRTGIDAATANAIIGYRTNTDGAPRWFMKLEELRAIPGVTSTVLETLIADATANGFVEAPGFDTPDAVRLAVPDNLGHAPTADDVTIEAGFDGKGPAEVIGIVRHRVRNTVHPDNERFANETVTKSHKAFTIALNNLFAKGSPTERFLNEVRADRITLLGTVSWIHPTFLIVERAGATTYYARGEGGGGYQEVAKPSYPVLMRARIRPSASPEGPGVRVFYPAWSSRALVAPTAVVLEDP